MRGRAPAASRAAPEEQTFCARVKEAIVVAIAAGEERQRLGVRCSK